MLLRKKMTLSHYKCNNYDLTMHTILDCHSVLKLAEKKLRITAVLLKLNITWRAH